MTLPADTTATPPPRTWLRVGLIVLAAIETLSALADFSGIFYDYNHTTALLIFAQGVTKTRLAIAPLIAGAALVFASIGRLRHAIVALAALVLVVWLTELPSIAIHGLELSGGFVGLHLIAQRFIYPVIAVAAIVLAVRNQRLALAGALVSLPRIVAWLGVLAFGIGVMIYGF
jgi:hypothetical protein